MPQSQVSAFEQTVREPWQELLHFLPAACGVFGAAGEPLYLNEVAARLLGESPTLTGGDGAELAAGGKVLRVETRPVRFAGRPATLAVFRDETRSRALERELSQSERRLATVLHASPSAICITRLEDGLIRNFNDRFMELVGRSRAELVGKKIVDIGAWKSAEERSRVMRTLAAGRSVRNVEIQFRRRNGEIRSAVTSFELAQVDGERFVIGLADDVTDRREMRRTLADFSRRFQLLIERVDDYAIFLLDPKGRVATWNLGAERLKGYAEAEVVGKPVSIFFTKDDVRRRKPQRLLERAAAKGRVSQEGRIVRKDGTRFWADVLVTALRDESGSLTGYAKITRDLTERKKAQEAENLKRRDAIQREIVATVSHELRTPIAAIRGFAETLLNGAITDAKNRRGFVEIIDSHAERLSRLVEDILSLSALDAKTQGRPVRIGLKAFVEKAAAGLAPLVREKALKVSLEVPEKLAVRVDADRLGQVLYNLLSNAIKYNKAKGLIEVRAERKGARVLVSVRDTGVGVPKSQLPLIFERFHRTEEGRRTASGSGLGLSIVKKTVESWRGRVWAESSGRGTTFYFTAPAA